MQSRESGQAGGLRRQIGLWSAVAIIVSSMVGQGIFTTTGYLGHDLKEPLLIFALWAAGGLLALAGAFTYGELGALLPRAGGEYAYLRAAFGPLVAFVSGWATFIYGFCAPTALCGLAFMEYASFFVKELDPHSGTSLAGAVSVGRVAATGLIIVLTYVHYRRVAAGIRAQNALTLLKASAITLLLGAALLSGRAEPSLLVHGPGLPPAADLFPALAKGLLFITLAYSGWNAASYLGAEVVEPARILPRAATLGTLLVAALYFALNAAYLAAIPAANMKPSPNIASEAASVYFGAAGAGVIAAVILLTQLGSISAFILGGSRVAYAMAEDGLLWRGLARLSGDGFTPRRAVVLQGGAAAILCAAFRFTDLVMFASAVLMAASALACVALLVLRRKAPAAERAWRAPLGAFFPLLYIAGSACILAAAGWYLAAIAPREERIGAAIVALSIVLAAPLYFFLPSRRGRPHEPPVSPHPPGP